jgi:cell division protein FtsB
MPPSSDHTSESKRGGGVEPLRRKRVVAPPSAATFQRRTINLLLVFVTVVLVVDALVGEKGLMESMRARRQYREVAASLEAIRHENARLREEVRRLQEDPAAIEGVAREELGLIRPGEVVFIIKDEKPSR